jgi:hypothetical protein
MTGQPLIGHYVVLEQSNNGAVVDGYTPVTFNVTAGLNYTITATDDGEVYFNHWTNDFTVRVMPVTGTDQDVTYTAVYAASVQPPPVGTPYTISVTSQDINGTRVSGFYVDLRVNGYYITSGYTPVNFTNLEPGIPFQVVFYWYGSYYLRGLSNGDLNRYALTTFNTTGLTTTSLEGLYQYVPAVEAAALDVQARFPNGSVIGTTFNNTDYIQHTPGMWLTVTPPGSTTPFTGAFTGGSILPFVLIKDQAYVVTMTEGYDGCITFQSWADNGSTNSTRSVPLYTNTTLTAIYDQTGPCLGSGSGAAQAGAPLLQARTSERFEP